MTNTTGLDPDEAKLIELYDAMMGAFRERVTTARDFGVAAQLAGTEESALFAEIAWRTVARDARLLADSFSMWGVSDAHATNPT